MKPALSIVLPVYNGEPYLRAAIESVLNQTFSDFELIVIDDGSRDKSASIVKSFTDRRLRFFSRTNQGLAKTLNEGIGLATAPLVARQDQDDISLPPRFAKQVAYLRAHPDIAIVGTGSIIIDAEGADTGRRHQHPRSPRTLRLLSLFDSPFVHPSVIFRKDAVVGVGGYSSDPSRQPEDFDLWGRLLRNHQGANIDEPLIQYREVPTSMSREGRSKFASNLQRLSASHIQKALYPFGISLFSRTLAELYHGNQGIRLSTTKRVALRLYWEALRTKILGFDQQQHLWSELKPVLGNLRAALGLGGAA